MAASAPLLGSDVGRCIAHLHPDDAPRLWDAWQSICAARRAFRMRILGKSGEPQGSRAEMIRDRLETDQSLRSDPRTADERDDDARAADARWRAMIDAIPAPAHRMALSWAIDGFGGEMWRDQAPTELGTAVVRALVWVVGHVR